MQYNAQAFATLKLAAVHTCANTHILTCWTLHLGPKTHKLPAMPR
jgi:hypothetical protein